MAGSGKVPPVRVYLRAYMQKYIHTYIHACMHTYIHTYIRAYIVAYIVAYIPYHAMPRHTMPTYMPTVTRHTLIQARNPTLQVAASVGTGISLRRAWGSWTHHVSAVGRGGLWIVWFRIGDTINQSTYISTGSSRSRYRSPSRSLLKPR